MNRSFAKNLGRFGRGFKARLVQTKRPATWL